MLDVKPNGQHETCPKVAEKVPDLKKSRRQYLGNEDDRDA